MKIQLANLNEVKNVDDGVILDLLDRTQGAGLFTKNYLTSGKADPSVLFLVALHEGAFVGFSAARVLHTNDWGWYKGFGAPALEILRGKRVGSLESMSIVETLQGRGIGTEMTAARLAWLKSKSCDLAIGVSWVSGSVHVSANVFRRLEFTESTCKEKFYVSDSLAKKYVCPMCGPPPCQCAAIFFYKRLD